MLDRGAGTLSTCYEAVYGRACREPPIVTHDQLRVIGDEPRLGTLELGRDEAFQSMTTAHGEAV